MQPILSPELLYPELSLPNYDFIEYLDPELTLPNYDLDWPDFDYYAGSTARLPPHIDVIKKAMKIDLPPCSIGTLPVRAEDLILYFGKENDDLGRIDFSHVQEEDLTRLSGACDAATFGVNNRDVPDETYRKAGKLDSQYFSAKFDPAAAGLLDKLSGVLLVGHDEKTSIRAELYKLNVYGPGSFFKPHKDTPRGDDMFASLVIVFPTAHQGGSLRFRHGTFDHTFDSAAALAVAPETSIAFAAFYSDVDHEVLHVVSGYRVTVTYNLYYNTTARPCFDSSFSETQEALLRSAFSKLMTDTNRRVLPKGHYYVGFGMEHQYATDSLNITSLSNLTNLKGKDAIVMKICRELGLEATVQVFYEYINDYEAVLCNSVIPGEDYLDENLEEILEKLGDVKVVRELAKKNTTSYGHRGYDTIDRMSFPVARVIWATPAQKRNIRNEVETNYVTYGNQASLDTIYGTFCIIVKIPPVRKSQK